MHLYEKNRGVRKGSAIALGTLLTANLLLLMPSSRFPLQREVKVGAAKLYLDFLYVKGLFFERDAEWKAALLGVQYYSDKFKRDQIESASVVETSLQIIRQSLSRAEASGFLLEEGLNSLGFCLMNVLGQDPQLLREQRIQEELMRIFNSVKHLESATQETPLNHILSLFLVTCEQHKAASYELLIEVLRNLPALASFANDEQVIKRLFSDTVHTSQYIRVLSLQVLALLLRAPSLALPYTEHKLLSNLLTSVLSAHPELSPQITAIFALIPGTLFSAPSLSAERAVLKSLRASFPEHIRLLNI